MLSNNPHRATTASGNLSIPLECPESAQRGLSLLTKEWLVFRSETNGFIKIMGIRKTDKKHNGTILIFQREFIS